MTSVPSFSFETIFPFVIPVIFVAVFVLIIRAAVVQSRKERANLRQLADRLGLQMPDPGTKGWFATPQRRATGTFRGRSVQVYAYTTGAGKSRTSWCALSVSAAIRPGFSLKLTSENLFTKAGRLLGMDDITTGDPAFDAAFYVKSKQGSFVRAALIPEVRIRLLEVWKQHHVGGAFTVENGEVKYTEIGHFANAKICDRFPTLLELACDLAEIGEAWCE